MANPELPLHPWSRSDLVTSDAATIAAQASDDLASVLRRPGLTVSAKTNDLKEVIHQHVRP